MALPVFKSRLEIINAIRTSYQQTSLTLRAMYDSRIDAIVTDNLFIRIPIIDQINEGWGVFDTANVYQGNVYQLEKHLERIMFSAAGAKIPVPLTLGQMKEKVLQLISLFDCNNLRVRVFLSKGLVGESSEAQGIFYALLYTDPNQVKPETVKERSVSIPLKPRELAVIKTNNYLCNTLCSLEAKEKGGYMGVMLDENGYLAESAMANVAVILPGGHFRTPFPDKILEGTTIKRVLLFCEELVKNGELQSASRGNISLEEAKHSEEMLIVGGDNIVGITEFDGEPIGSGAMGIITRKIKNFLQQDHVSI
ncbi:unnamed protein product [Blepharisma stoltei]|uniref:Uncharacterized protein n=1 Tax=Blepharisma stoltei TaxID=1481888 RepID=A0AAU9INK1_9CILI|nr:unnamed protein product [Blepharisma stoltei]